MNLVWALYHIIEAPFWETITTIKHQISIY